MVLVLNVNLNQRNKINEEEKDTYSCHYLDEIVGPSHNLRPVEQGIVHHEALLHLKLQLPTNLCERKALLVSVIAVSHDSYCLMDM